MTRLFLDGEWDGEKLLSLALVAEGGADWYVVLDNKAESPWVREHVLPKLNQEAINKRLAQDSLQQFLSHFASVHIIVDWPEDVAQFCKFLILEPGCRLDTPPLTFEILRWLNSDASVIPHNALSDAWAIRDMYFEGIECHGS